MRRIIIITISIFLLGFSLFAANLNAKKFTFEFHKEFPAGSNPTLFLSNISGKVMISSHSKEKIIIHALKVIKTGNLKRAEELAQKIEIDVKKDGGDVNIHTKYPRSRFLRRVSCWVNYEIFVPPKTELNIKTTSADVEIEDIQQKVRINTVSGDIRVESINGVIDFSSVSGDFYLQDIQGNLILEGTSSDMELNHIQGDLRIDCVSGDIRLSQIDGDIEASTSSGDIEVRQDQGGLDLNTVSGDVEVKTEISPENEYGVETTSGEIVFYLPQDSNARLNCETQSGSIRTEIPISVLSTSRNFLKGELGSGGSRIYLSTVSGDVEVRGY
jgi:DUF4097 and DUF4098 domain-containing protein YvlB